MTASLPTPAQRQHAQRPYQGLYPHLLDELPEVRDPNSKYWRTHFSAAAGQLARLMGVDRYRQWFDRQFPPISLYSWRQQFDVAIAALQRIQERAEKFTEQQIEIELNAPLGKDGR